MENDNNQPYSFGGPSVDLNKIPALNQRRSVTFVNHFIIHSVNFLNNFAAVAEEKLATQSLEMQKLEIALNILEAKLASIPGLDGIAETTKDDPGATRPATNEVQPEIADPTPDIVEVPQQPVEIQNVVTVKQDPRYAKYLKMVTVGVPKVAIENKMRMEGLDPALLDNPDAPVPDAAAPTPSDESDNESQSLSSDASFSD
uniref:WASH complex subunit 3 n=1 Tax=Phallusia mammillata TaxID=59560 RepID=A0A6F9DW34_9ASCI|nr:WASH complex subunit CCDC53-like [Phallusia mammillata]